MDTDMSGLQTKPSTTEEPSELEAGPSTTEASATLKTSTCVPQNMESILEPLWKRRGTEPERPWKLLNAWGLRRQDMFAEFSILEAVDNWSLDATPGDELDKAIREYGGEHKAKMLKRAVLRHVERIRCDRLSPLHPSHPPHPAAQFGSFKFGKVTAHSRDGVAKCFNFSGDPKGVITAESAKATTHSGVAIVADRGGSGTGCGAFKFEVGHADAHATGTGRASVYGVPEPDTPC